MTTCKGVKKDGTPCGSPIVLDNGYCLAHRDQATEGKEAISQARESAQDTSGNDDSTSQTFSEQVAGRWRRIQLKWPLIGRLVFVVVVVWFCIEAYNQLTGEGILKPLQDLIPTPTPTPFTTPAAEGEYLIIITRFRNEAVGSGYDVRNILGDGIEEVLPDSLNARVVRAEDEIPDSEEEAQSIGKRYKATIVLWGHYATNALTIHFTPLVQLEVSTKWDASLPVQNSADGLISIVNEQAPGRVRWLSLITVGQALYLTGQHDAAIATFDSALGLLEKAEPKHPEVIVTYFYRGSAHYFNKQFDDAITDLTTIITDLDPENAEAYNSRGLAHFAKREFRTAISDYTQAIALKGNYAEAYNNRGAAYFKTGEYTLAMADYDQAVEIRPEYAEALSNRGALYLVKSGDDGGVVADIDKAIADLSKANELQPKNATTLYLLGRAFLIKGDFPESHVYFARAAELTDDESLQELAQEYGEFVASDEPAFPWTGDILNTFQNCGLTRVFGFVLTRNGGLAGDVWVHYWADGWEGAWAKSQWTDFGAGTSWTNDEGNWDGTLDARARDGVWHVCVVPADGSWDCISNTVDAATSSDCQDGVQVVHITFRQN